MHALLAIHNIHSLGVDDDCGVEQEYYFTRKMFDSRIFIELRTVDIPGQSDVAENEPEEQEFEDEVEDDEDDYDDYEEDAYYTYLAVILQQGSHCYEIVIHNDEMDLSPPVKLAQTILFLVKVITEAADSQLVDCLKSISAGWKIPHEMEDPAQRQMVEKGLQERIDKVVKNIQDIDMPDNLN